MVAPVLGATFQRGGARGWGDSGSVRSPLPPAGAGASARVGGRSPHSVGLHGGAGVPAVRRPVPGSPPGAGARPGGRSRRPRFGTPAPASPRKGGRSVALALSPPSRASWGRRVGTHADRSVATSCLMQDRRAGPCPAAMGWCRRRLARCDRALLLARPFGEESAPTAVDRI